MDIQDRGKTFSVEGVRLDEHQETFRKLLVDILESSVRASGKKDVDSRRPICQREGFVAYPPHKRDSFFCIISTDDHEWVVEDRMDIVWILQRI